MNETNLVDYEGIVNSLISGIEICRFDDNFTIEYTNTSFAMLLGYGKEKDFVGLSHISFVYPADMDYLPTKIKSQINLDNNYVIEYRMVKKDGSLIWVVEKGMLSKGIYLQRFFTDITSIKQQNKDLEQFNKDLIIIANSIKSAIIACNSLDVFSLNYANDGFYELIGYSREEFNLMHNNILYNLIYPEDAGFLKENILKQLKKSSSANCTIRLIRKNSEIIWVMLKGIVVKKENYLPVIYITLADITEQKEKEEALLISKKRYETALRFSGVITFDYNLKTKEIIIAEKEAKIFGLPSIIPDAKETLIKHGFIDIIYANEFREMFDKIHKGKKIASCNVYVNSKQGHEYALNIILVNTFDKKKNPISTIGIIKNVTQLRILQKEQEYGNTMSYNKTLKYEANITRNEVLYYNPVWAEEFNVSVTSSFTDLITFFCNNVIEESSRERVLEILDVNNIIKSYEKDKRRIILEYRKKSANGNYRWYKNSINIIKDATTNDINVRCYIVDINDEKIKEIDDKKKYDLMLSTALFVYDINFTKNCFISGAENLKKLFEIEWTSEYNKMMLELSKKSIHPNDVEEFKNNFLQKNVLSSFEKGEKNIVYSYRRPDETGNFIWVKTTINISRDPATLDIVGYMFIENTDKEKKKEIDLIYKAEHDNLTGFYNKDSSEQYITNFLESSEGILGKHAFFIIDIDYFKSINDSLGHAFGDAVISQTASKISDLFRKIDIMGRIGGDEFIVFMKNIGDEKIAIIKAQELCLKLKDTFTKEEKTVNMSVSIGIAIYNKHGKTYDGLYKNSDTALYVSKQRGRDTYTLYSNLMDEQTTDNKLINCDEIVNPKIFEENIAEYVFRILYASDDKIAAINSVLELIGRHFNVSRAYVYEDTISGEFTKNTFEWCCDSVSIRDISFKTLDYKTLSNYKSNFNEDRIFYVYDSKEIKPELKNILIKLKIKSFLQFSIIEDGKFKGFVGYDEFKPFRTPSKSELFNLQKISNVLSVFILEMRALQRTQTIRNISDSILN